MSEIIYLATPYTHPDKYMEEIRFLCAAQVAAALMREGNIVFSPIAHTHWIARMGELPAGWDYWRQFDEAFIKVCTKLIVVKMIGWEDSKGVKAEIEIAKELGKPVEYMDQI